MVAEWVFSSFIQRVQGVFNEGRKGKNQTKLGAVKQSKSHSILQAWLGEKTRENICEQIFLGAIPENINSPRDRGQVSGCVGRKGLQRDPGDWQTCHHLACDAHFMGTYVCQS